MNFPDVYVTSDVDRLDTLVDRAVQHFRASGHFVCPATNLHSAMSSGKMLSEQECPCWKAILEARETGKSACGLLETEASQQTDIKETVNELKANSAFREAQRRSTN